MLSRITIRVIWSSCAALDLDLRRGDGTLTGGTGAGKSILIDALGLALGRRQIARMIHVPAQASGGRSASVSNLEDDSPALDWLAQQTRRPTVNVCCVAMLVRNGWNRAYINGIPTPQALLRELGDRLVDIHGQHAHQSLLRCPLLSATAGCLPAARRSARTGAAVPILAKHRQSARVPATGRR